MASLRRGMATLRQVKVCSAEERRAPPLDDDCPPRKGTGPVRAASPNTPPKLPQSPHPPASPLCPPPASPRRGMTSLYQWIVSLRRWMALPAEERCCSASNPAPTALNRHTPSASQDDVPDGWCRFTEEMRRSTDGWRRSTEGRDRSADGWRCFSDGVAPPRNGVAPPRKGVVPPMDGVDPPMNGIAPPKRGADPPMDGVTLPIDGVAPPRISVLPPMYGIAPPRNGVVPLRKSAAPLNTAWPCNPSFTALKPLAPPASFLPPSRRSADA